MITKIELKDFKIHASLELPLSGLTILTGQNGMGKSSVLQSLLLLRQSYSQYDNIRGINLKGNLIDLGSANDVECQSSQDGILGIKVSLSDGTDLDFRFSYDVEPNDTFLPIITEKSKYEGINRCALFTNSFQYISAFRLGPQKGYERDTDIVQYQGQISKINGQCEYAVHYLYYYGKKVHCLPQFLIGEDDTLESQVQSWMRYISPRVNINIEPIGADFKLNYKFSREGQPVTDEMSAVNVGYGVTYVLPILVAILSAVPGSLVLIENPEAHIHPRAQAELMKLIMKAVKAGIQIIIETHSDHIMNGALVAIADDSENLECVKAYYFERDDASHTSIPRILKILNDGRIQNPPKGFFDQIDIDMRAIMGF